MNNELTTTPNSPDSTQESNKTLTTIIYGLYAFSCLFGITAIVAIVINYIKKEDVAGTIFESHFRWQIRTFWFGLLWWLLAWGVFWVLGLLTLGIGMMVLWILPFGVFAWYLYRVIIGWIKLNDNKTVGT